MSTPEIVGLMMTIALFGLTAGAAVTAMVTSRRGRTADGPVRARDALAAWLAARNSLTRTSVSFVAAFRALAAERGEDARAELRREEAQRARADWCDAMKVLDRAEAELHVWHPDAGRVTRITSLPRASVEELRIAIDGPRQQVDQFVGEWRERDGDALRMVQAEVAPNAVRPSACRDVMGRMARFAGVIADRWSQRPR